MISRIQHRKECEGYARLDRRPYHERKSRYQVACDRLLRGGLCERDIVVDIGAGYTELDFCLRTEHGWRGRYVPIDGWVDGTDIEKWAPEFDFHWFAALELLEHLHDPKRLVEELKARAEFGFVITTPNPDVVDVLAMDPTHITPLSRDLLESWGIYTTLHNFYGTHEDGIAGMWTRRDVR
ncbi:hypothetical protein [Streptomyces eurocidicus]|uniref:Class I SAM-dependent methyltransferase n=1 Tax=Streptomyces eurocidicus TaxID=66423 RepID=A0A7W8BJG7_STREU|nr:hypothetical protein [Streptomyces eurocidicus]MBB5123088.1 hypothetical protein [Streptomyces eurocidicus]